MRGVLVCGLALGVALGVSGCSAAGPVNDSQASVVASSLISAAKIAVQSEEDDRYCGIVAADTALCENSWASWMMQGSPLPGFDTLVVETEALDDGTQKLTFTGEYVDGGSFTSEVIVTGTGDGPRATDPVFWIER
jgi:hypothetical protein